MNVYPFEPEEILNLLNPVNAQKAPPKLRAAIDALKLKISRKSSIDDFAEASIHLASVVATFLMRRLATELKHDFYDGLSDEAAVRALIGSSDSPWFKCIRGVPHAPNMPTPADIALARKGK